MWRGCTGAPYRYQSLCIGQAEVEQDNVNRAYGQICLGILHAVHMDQFDVVRVLLGEHFAEQTRVSRIILNQENYFYRFWAHPPCLCCGSLTLVNQKSLMLFTRLSNASSCTGLVR